MTGEIIPVMRSQTGSDVGRSALLSGRVGTWRWEQGHSWQTDQLSVLVSEVDQEGKPCGSEDKVKCENSLMYSYF